MVQRDFADRPIDTRDGVKVTVEWLVPGPGSNTEPIVRVVAEAGTMEAARDIVASVMDKVKAWLGPGAAGAHA